MKTIILNRILKTSEVTIGVITLGTKLFTTLELPWKDNQKNISCIPEGEYKVVLTYSNKFKKIMPEILGVPNRSGIRFHVANYTSDLEGCIGVGEKLSFLNDDNILDITHSKKAFRDFKLLIDECFILKIQ